MSHSTPSLPRQFFDNGTRFLNLRAFGASPRPPSILQTIEEPLWSLQTAYLAHQGSNLFFAYVLTCLQFIFYGPSPPRHTPRALAVGNGVRADVRHKDGTKTTMDGGCGIRPCLFSSISHFHQGTNVTDQSRAVGIIFFQSCGLASRFGALKALDCVVLDV